MADSPSRPGTSALDLDALLDATGVALMACEPSGRIAFANRAAAALLGASRESVVGSSFPDVLVGDGQPDEARALLVRATEDRSEARAWDWRTPGGPVAVHCRLRPLPTAPGTSPLVVVEARPLEGPRPLEDPEPGFRQLLDRLGAGVVIFGRTGNIYVNRQAAELVGYTLEELRRLPFWHVIHPDFLELAKQRGMARIGGESVPDRYELKVVRKDGEERWVEFAGAPVDFAGEPAVVAAVVDITRRKAALSALAESEERLRSLSAVTLEGIVTHEAGTIVDVNERGATLFGRSPEALVGSPVEALAAPDSRARLRSALASGEPGPFVVGGFHADGSSFPMEVTTRSTEYRGRTLQVAGLRDVTDRVRLEAERKHAEDQLHRAARLESVGLLAGGIAHDFNNILSVVISYADLALQSVEEGSALHTDLSEILSAGRLAAALTRQLLVFSKRDLTDSVVLDANRVVEDVETLLRRTISENIELETDLHPDLWCVRMSGSHLEQVLVNLAINARDAMPDGGKFAVCTTNLTLSAERGHELGGLPAGDYVRLRAADTGEGMAESIAARVFEPFFTTKEPGRGTGLGLSIVYGVVTGAGGAIDLETTVGVGTRFDIYLPRCREKPTTLPADRIFDSTAGGTVLVVEDQQAVLSLVTRILARSGYRVLGAASLAEAQAMVEGHESEIDLLITDVVMPGGSGVELASRLSEARPGLPVVFMSGYSDDVLRRHDMPRRRFLQKPFRANDLLARVAEVLGETSTVSSS